MSAIVADASAIGPLLLLDERNQILPGLESMFEADGEGALVPSHWRLETASMIQIAHRRGRLTNEGRDTAIALLRDLFVEVDPDTDAHALGASWQLSEVHSLTIYDAAYLELAHRSRKPLATADVALARAAQREGIQLFGR